MSPAETVAMIVALRQAGKMDEAASHSVDDAVLVLAPWNHAVGHDPVRDGLVALATTFPVFNITSRTTVQTGDIALHHSSWSARGIYASGGPTEAGGVTADVPVRQPDGSWKVAIDNPWGSTLLVV